VAEVREAELLAIDDVGLRRRADRVRGNKPELGPVPVAELARIAHLDPEVAARLRGEPMEASVVVGDRGDDDVPLRGPRLLERHALDDATGMGQVVPLDVVAHVADADPDAFEILASDGIPVVGPPGGSTTDRTSPSRRARPPPKTVLEEQRVDSRGPNDGSRKTFIGR
jgi:hypothetical protein